MCSAHIRAYFRMEYANGDVYEGEWEDGRVRANQGELERESVCVCVCERERERVRVSE